MMYEILIDHQPELAKVTDAFVAQIQKFMNEADLESVTFTFQSATAEYAVSVADNYISVTTHKNDDSPLVLPEAQ